MATGLFELTSPAGDTIKKYFIRLDTMAAWLQDHPGWTWRRLSFGIPKDGLPKGCLSV